MSLPKVRAKQILEDLRIDRSLLLERLPEICCERGAYVKEESLHGSEGRLVTDGKRGIITVRPAGRISGTSEGRQRFSIAHELGHFELHRHLRALWDCKLQDMSSWSSRLELQNRESEANAFAAELLMPGQWLLKEMDQSQPGLGFLKSLATRYRVSLSAISQRYVELSSEPCAVVFFRGEKVIHSARSSILEKQKHWRRLRRVSADSMAYGSYYGRTAAGSMIPVKTKAWLDGVAARANVSVLEESEYFRGMDFGISLIWLRDLKLPAIESRGG